MNRVVILNLAGLAAAIAVSLLAVALSPRAAMPAVKIDVAAPIETVTLLDGRLAVTDARGTAVPVDTYVRIASAGLVGDALLAELCEPQRIVAYSAYSVGAQAYKLGDKPRVNGLADLEIIIGLKPDLVLASSYGAGPDAMARLQEAGIAVFDLGDARGVATFTRNARQIGALLGIAPRVARFVAAYERNLESIAAALPASTPRLSGMFIALVGDQMYGGTVGTSYHDVMRFAAVDDCAATRYRDWPSYSPEAILALNPELIVTKTGMAAGLRRMPGLDRLPACQRPGGIVELDADALEDPGILIPDAAAQLFKAVYGK